MQHEPTIGQRGELPYAGIRMQFPMDGFAAAVDEAFPELFGWLAAWRSRVEHYLTDPSAEPDPARWEVDIAYLASK